MSLLKKIFDSRNKRDQNTSTFSKTVFEQPANIELKNNKFEDLTEKEKEYIKTYSKFVEDALILLGVLSARNNTVITPELIDNGIENYFKYELELKEELDGIYDTIPNVLAVGWGQYLIDNYNMEWHVITDNWGTEIGVAYRDEKEQKEIILFPFQSVAKAIQHKYDTYIFYMTEETQKLINFEKYPPIS